MKKQPVVVETLGDLKRSGIDLYIACDNGLCHHPGGFRREELIAMFGPDKPYRNLRYKCKKCGFKASGRLVTF